jgi:hypothetical protein
VLGDAWGWHRAGFSGSVGLRGQTGLCTSVRRLLVFIIIVVIIIIIIIIIIIFFFFFFFFFISIVLFRRTDSRLLSLHATASTVLSVLSINHPYHGTAMLSVQIMSFFLSMI